MVPESGSNATRHINLVAKWTGKPTAGNPHGGFDAAGTGNGFYGLASEALPEETGSQRIGGTFGVARQSSTLLTRLRNQRRAVRRIIERIAELPPIGREAALTQLLILAGLRRLAGIVVT